MIGDEIKIGSFYVDVETGFILRLLTGFVHEFDKKDYRYLLQEICNINFNTRLLNHISANENEIVERLVFLCTDVDLMMSVDMQDDLKIDEYLKNIARTKLKIC